MSAQLAWANFDQLRMLTPVVACWRRGVRNSFAGAAMMRRTQSHLACARRNVSGIMVANPISPAAATPARKRNAAL
jgi:hypothetical protein